MLRHDLKDISNKDFVFFYDLLHILSFSFAFFIATEQLFHYSLRLFVHLVLFVLYYLLPGHNLGFWRGKT